MDSQTVGQFLEAIERKRFRNGLREYYFPVVLSWGHNAKIDGELLTCQDVFFFLSSLKCGPYLMRDDLFSDGLHSRNES